MLLSFKCSNYRSIRDEQSLTMLSGQTRNLDSQVMEASDAKGEKAGVLKSAFIFGANGSGKSNFFKAIRFSSQFIMKMNPDYEVDSSFMLDPNYRDRESVFEYEIEMNGRMFRYGFAMIMAQRKVTGEWLSEIFIDAPDREIFHMVSDGVYSFEGRECAASMEDGELFLHRYREKDPSVYSGDELLMCQLNDWFYYNLAVLKPNSSLLWTYDFDSQEGVDKMADFLSRFDTGITGMGFFDWKEGEENDELPKNPTSRIDPRSKIIRGNYAFFRETEDGGRQVLRCVHGNRPMYFTQESDGTSRLMKLAPIILCDDKPLTVVVDEFDRYLHPVVVRGFVEWFLRKKFVHPHQLIIVTHNVHLLDQDLVRRDEIWFVQKNEEGVSELYSLDDYNVRFDKKIEKAYLNGFFKGIPRVTLPRDLDSD